MPAILQAECMARKMSAAESMYDSSANKLTENQSKTLKSMQCPCCNSKHVNKNGRKKGKQNYICLDCKKQFIDSYDRRGYAQVIKQECLEMYANGMRFREIEKVKGIHHTTIINWVNQLKSKADLQPPTSDRKTEE
jgi:transposase-like protein